MGGNQLSHAIGRLSAFANPVFDTVEVQLKATLFALRDRIEKSNLFKGSAALTLTAIRHHDVIERLVFGTTTGQPNRNHVASCLDIANRRLADLKMGRE
jgi:hypothetical protein